MRVAFLLLAIAVVANAFLPHEPRGHLLSSESKRAPVTCRTASCVALAGTCGIGTNSDYLLCNANTFCNFTTTTGSCVNSYASGHSCTGDDQCMDSLSCNTNAVCQATTYTAGVGAACTTYNQCSGSLTCYNAICVTTPTVGQSCMDKPFCAGNSFCHYKTQTCTAGYSIAAGQNCTDTDDCVAGYFCGNMTLNANFRLVGICIQGFSSSNKDCTDTTTNNCNQYETCSCGTNNNKATCQAPDTNSQAEVDAFSKEDDCELSNNCGGGGDDIIAACPMCKSQICNVLSVLRKDPEYEQLLDLGSCFVPPALQTVVDKCSSGSSLSASLLFLFGMLLVLAL